MRPIDADDLISVLDILSDKGGDIRYWEQLKWIVADCPTADVQEVKHGRWEWKDNLKAEDENGWLISEQGYVCSECGFIGSDNFRYCPNCGAKMEGIDE